MKYFLSIGSNIDAKKNLDFAYKELKNILDEYSPILEGVNVEDVKKNIEKKRLPRLKKVQLPFTYFFHLNYTTYWKHITI